MKKLRRDNNVGVLRSKTPMVGKQYKIQGKHS